MGTISLEPQLVLSYPAGEVSKTTSIPWHLLRDVARGLVCPTTLSDVSRLALVHNHFLEEVSGGLYRSTPRLAWQTGLPLIP